MSAVEFVKLVLLLCFLYGCWWVLKRLFIAVNLLLRPSRKKTQAALVNVLGKAGRPIAHALDQAGLDAFNTAAKEALSLGQKADALVDAAVDAEVARIATKKRDARIDPSL